MTTHRWLRATGLIVGGPLFGAGLGAALGLVVWKLTGWAISEGWMIYCGIVIGSLSGAVAGAWHAASPAGPVGAEQRSLLLRGLLAGAIILPGMLLGAVAGFALGTVVGGLTAGFETESGIHWVVGMFFGSPVGAVIGALPASWIAARVTAPRGGQEAERR